MRTLTLGERFENYVDAFQRCGLHTLNLTDEEIGYHIFEEFDTDVISFLYKDSLKLFRHEGLIDENIAEKSKLLRESVLNLHGTQLWNIESFKTAEEWLEVMKLSDEIKELIYERWPDNLLDELYSLNVYL